MLIDWIPPPPPGVHPLTQKSRKCLKIFQKPFTCKVCASFIKNKKKIKLVPWHKSFKIADECINYIGERGGRYNKIYFSQGGLGGIIGPIIEWTCWCLAFEILEILICFVLRWMLILYIIIVSKFVAKLRKYRILLKDILKFLGLDYKI